MGFPGDTSGKESPWQSIRRRPGRSPEEGNGSPLQYSCRKNSKDRWSWQATVHGITVRLSNWAQCNHIITFLLKPRRSRWVYKLKSTSFGCLFSLVWISLALLSSLHVPISFSNPHTCSSLSEASVLVRLSLHDSQSTRRQRGHHHARHGDRHVCGALGKMRSMILILFRKTCVYFMKMRLLSSLADEKVGVWRIPTLYQGHSAGWYLGPFWWELGHRPGVGDRRWVNQRSSKSGSQDWVYEWFCAVCGT